MSNQKSAVQPWATLSFCVDESPSGVAASPDALESLVDRLDAIGSLIAELEGVGGVVTRDPALFGSTATEPELVVYTTPPFVEDLEVRGLALAGQFGLRLRASTQVRIDDDWRDSWKDFYEHKIFGEGDLLLRPSWLERRVGDPACEIVLDPGRAFGTGYHESTRLCLEVLMKRAREGLRVPAALDLGCGSGILGLAWAKRCASPDHATQLHFVDIDKEAVDTARENAQINDLDSVAHYYVGGADACPQAFALVIANIRPAALVPFAAEICARVAPGGELLLSGILLEEAPEIHSAYEALGFACVDQPVENDWCAQLWRHADSQDPSPGPHAQDTP